MGTFLFLLILSACKPNPVEEVFYINTVDKANKGIKNLEVIITNNNDTLAKENSNAEGLSSFPIHLQDTVQSLMVKINDTDSILNGGYFQSMAFNIIEMQKNYTFIILKKDR